ncbi:MAG: hypothetical protein H5T86_00910 [Armatimonadetes bacterium]|nr:hypothetical protein [Armatimonadota bacterium]
MTTVTVRTLDPDRSVALVSVAGWLSEDQTDRFRRAILSAADSHTSVIADLSGALDLTAAAVGALAEAAATVRWRGGRLAVVAPGEVAARLTAAGMSDALSVLPSLEQAQKLVAGAQ